MGYYKTDMRQSEMTTQIVRVFADNSPLVISKKPARERFLDDLQEQIKQTPGFKTQGYQHYRYNEKVLSFEVELESKFLNDVGFKLAFNEESQLCLKYKYSDGALAFVKDVEDLLRLATVVHKVAVLENKYVEKIKLEELKKEKIKTLKFNAIESKIQELCAEEQVPYYLEKGFKSKVKLTVRLSDSERMEVDVPYSNYQNILQNLQSAIQALLELQKKGITVKVKSSLLTNREADWINPIK